MPTETRALTRLLGMVQPADRPVVAAELQGRQGELSSLWFSWRAGGDRALGRGLALAAAALGTAGASSKVALMLADPDPQVRAAAAEALGALGAVGAIPGLSARIADPDPEVAVAAIGGLVALAIRVGRPDLARDVLARVGGTLPEAVGAAIAEARARLE
jgi:HEAT repeat protein